MRIALTGNIGSGKTEASKVFSNHGFKVINADTIGHELYKKREIMREITREFGEQILTNGEIDRRKLKNIVFYNPKELKKLNAIMHPLIIKEIKKRITKKCVIEGALIFEVDFKEYDYAIVIAISREEQKTRLLKKGKYKEREINNILDSQMNQEKKIEKADYVIENSGSKEELKENIEKVINNMF